MARKQRTPHQQPQAQSATPAQLPAPEQNEALNAPEQKPIETPAIIMATHGSEAMEFVPENTVGNISLTQDNQKIVDDVMEVEPVHDMYGFNAKAEALKFLEEIVTITISESTDQNAPSMVFLAVNGEGAGKNGVPWLPRGISVKVKRKFVERLARAKRTSYSSKERINADGEREIYYPSRTALEYPFVVEEDSAKGREWLRGILSEA